MKIDNLDTITYCKVSELTSVVMMIITLLYQTNTITIEDRSLLIKALNKAINPDC